MKVLKDIFRLSIKLFGFNMIDEDMTSMDTVMVGEWHGVLQGHLGCPNQEGGPRLIRFESPRWRSKETKVGVHLGVPEQPAPKLTPRPHTEFVLDALYMDGKIISRSFQQHWFEPKFVGVDGNRQKK